MFKITININHIFFLYNLHKFVTQHRRWRTKPLSFDDKCSSISDLVRKTLRVFLQYTIRGTFLYDFNYVINQFLPTRLEPNRENINLWALQIAVNTGTVPHCVWSVLYCQEHTTGWYSPNMNIVLGFKMSLYMLIGESNACSLLMNKLQQLAIFSV